jgi:hypothetical protein
MEKIEELKQKYIFDRLECLKWDSKYYKYKNTKLSSELEKSEAKLVDILKEIRELESLRVRPKKNK